MSSLAHFLIQFIYVFLTIGATFAAPIILPLSHRLSETKFKSPTHLLKAGSARSSASARRPAVSLPLSPGSDYTVTFSIGSAPNHQSISMYMDTGSDVVWFPCAPFECILCEGKEIPPSLASTKFNLNHSATTAAVHCSSSSCSAAHASLPTSDLCAMANCPLESIELSSCPKSSSCPPFYYAYGDGSFVAKLYHDTLSIPSLKVQDFTFGCAHTTLAEPIGVAGFGRGSLSLPAQLARVSPQLGNQFSYCLISHNYRSDKLRRPSPLILGRRESGNRPFDSQKDKNDELVYTPMLKNPKHPYFYCVGLTGISIGKTNIPAPASFHKVDSKGNGGFVVDSGTTFTMLPEKFYNSLAAEFDKRVSRVGKRVSQTESTLGLSHCYAFDDDVARRGVVPSLTLHFGGDRSLNGSSLLSSVTLPKRNYFYEFMDGGDGGRKRRMGCLMLINGGDDAEEEASGPSGILGNYFQQGFEVVYDLEKERVGFVRRRCDSLWDEVK